MKKCGQCNKDKPLEEFSQSQRMCKDCAAKYYQDWKEKQIEKYGYEGYLERIWEKRLRTRAARKNIPCDVFDINNVNNCNFKIIDYPDKAFPYSLNHIDFMKKYELSVDEYLFIRKKVKNGEYKVV